MEDIVWVQGVLSAGCCVPGGEWRVLNPGFWILSREFWDVRWRGVGERSARGIIARAVGGVVR